MAVGTGKSKTRYTVEISRDLDDEVAALAYDWDVSKADIIRHALREFVKSEPWMSKTEAV